MESNRAVLLKGRLSEENDVVVTVGHTPTIEELDKLIEIIILIRNGWNSLCQST